MRNFFNVISTTAARTAGKTPKSRASTGFQMVLDPKKIEHFMRRECVESVAQLSRNSGVSRSVLQDFIGGKPGVSAKTVGAIASALSVYPEQVSRWISN